MVLRTTLFIFTKSIELVQSAVPIDDEEDIDEDTFEEFVDPWGIIYKPLKVRSCCFLAFSVILCFLH